MLIRYQSSSDRGPSPSVWHGITDWVRGSLATALGQSDFADFAPDDGQNDVDGSSGAAGALDTTQRFGVVSITASAGSDAQVGLGRPIWFTLSDSPILAIEARIDQNADANSPQTFIGFSDQANFDDVFASGVINSGNNEDALGLLWNADETIDIVAVDDGTLTVLKDNIGVTVERTSGYNKFALRAEYVNANTYRLVPTINGSVARSGIVNVASTLIPENPMRPGVATTVSSVTAPDVDIDFIYSGDK